MRRKFSCYEYEVKLMPPDEQQTDKWYYLIYGEGFPPYYDGVIESDEWFHHECEASLAAIGHITLLENGEGYND